MSPNVRIINHCNQWHEYSSFRLIAVVEEEYLEDTLIDIQKALNYSEQDMNDYIHVSEKIKLNDLYNL